MKILLLPPYFKPEQMASSHLDDNRYVAFAHVGFDMELYVSSPTRGVDDETRLRYEELKKDVDYEGKMKVYRFSMFREGKNPILRALRYVFCWCAQFWKGICAKDIDLIFLASTPPIQGVLGGLLKKIKKVSFVYNLQDIFPDS